MHYFKLFLQAQTFQNIEDLTLFLTSQERQAIINYQLNSLRAEAGDQIGKLKFREGEAISKLPSRYIPKLNENFNSCCSFKESECQNIVSSISNS